jgi:hypothetical protein
MIRTLQSILHRAAPETEQVHFHQGPQGSPAPCYDRHCNVPRLEIDGRP